MQLWRDGRGRYLALALLVAAALILAFALRDMLSFQTLSRHRDALIAYRDANYAAAVALFMAGYVLIVALGLPGGTMATVTGGFLFTTFPGVVFNVVAATTGAILIFLAVRWGLGDRLAARMDAAEGRVRRLKAGIGRNLWEVLFLLRLVPGVPFFIANLLPALAGARLAPFAVTTFFGIMPGTLVYTSLGAGLSEVFARGETPDLGVIFEPRILWPILGLCLLAALPVVVRTLRGKRTIKE